MVMISKVEILELISLVALPHKVANLMVAVSVAREVAKVVVENPVPYL